MNLKEQMKMSAGTLSKGQMINESSLDIEKRKIQVKVRALNIISGVMNDIEYLKKEIVRTAFAPFITSPYNPQEVPQANPEEVKTLKKMCYKIFKEKFSVVEEMIEKEFGDNKKSEESEEDSEE